MQGGIASVQSLAMLLGTVVFSQIFGYFLKPSAPVISPNIAFYIAAGLMGSALILFWFNAPKKVSS
jgi:MFS transporter, DHA1 family, tetracycline resistance protein